MCNDKRTRTNREVTGMLSVLRCSCKGGAELYEAAVLLKEVLRGRGVLLIEERTDIVGAAEADGVVLSRQGATLAACCAVRTLTQDLFLSAGMVLPGW